jgi:arylsulfatase A-like enzyme
MRMIRNMLGGAGIVLVPAVTAGMTAEVDIRPGDATNFIDTESPYTAVHVAVLSTSVADGEAQDFNAADVNPTTVRFGAAEPDANFLAGALKDVDADGDTDLDLVFAVADTGIACEDPAAAVTGELNDTTSFSGGDSITTPDCPACHSVDDEYRDVVEETFFVLEDNTLQVTEPAAAGFQVLETGASNGSLALGGNGSFSYTPDANFYGIDGFEYRDAASQLRDVTISVIAVNDPPMAVADAVGIASGRNVNRPVPGVLANDTDVDGDTLTVQLGAAASEGNLQLNPDGSFTYEPGPAFDGHDAFTYTVSDGQITSSEVEVNISLPNILIIYVDDMGQGDAPVYNPGSAIAMPNLDALAAAGMRFTNAHSASSVCSPSRYSLLSGNYPYRGRRQNGVWKAYDADTMLLPEQLTIAEALGPLGYRSAFIGKVHNGGAMWNEAGTAYTNVHADMDYARAIDRGPTQFGFDYAFTLPTGVGGGPYAYFENDRMTRYDTWTGVFQPFATADQARSFLIQVTANQSYNGGTIGNSGWAMDQYDSRKAGPFLTRQALEFIDDHVQQNASSGTHNPFLLYVATPEPHTPWTPPPVFNVNDPTDISAGAAGTPIAGATPISARTDMVFETDVILGTLVSELDAKGLLDNTLIVFTSDNSANMQNTQAGYQGTGIRIEEGPGGDQHINAQGTVNGVPLSGYKAMIGEGGHMVPFVVRWGNGTAEGSLIPPGSAAPQMFGGQDLIASIADLVGVTLPADQANDSFNFGPVMLDEIAPGAEVRDHMFVQGTTTSAGWGRLDRALYKWHSNGDLWKLVGVSDVDDYQANLEFTALYNLTDDPAELNNRIADSSAQTWLATMTSEYVTTLGLARTAN